MLKKLLKYDLKYIYKTLIIFYLVSLSLAIITRGFFYLSHSSIFHILGQITSGVTIIMIFSIIVNTIVRVWTRFTQNMYKDESYLTHTLPVKKGTIYLSKFLSSLMTMFSSILVIFLTIAIAYYSKENLEFVKLSLEGLATIYDSTAIKLILILMLFTVSLNLFKSTPLLESAFFITFVNAVKTSPIFLNFLKLWINGLI